MSNIARSIAKYLTRSSVPRPRGIVLLITSIIAAAIVAASILYLQLENSAADLVYLEEASWQAETLAEAAADEGLWFRRQVSANFRGPGPLIDAPRGQYQYAIISSRDIRGFGYVPAQEQALAQGTVQYSAAFDLAPPLAGTLVGRRYALWLGGGLAVQSWPANLRVQGGAVYSDERDIFFTGGDARVIERSLVYFGAGTSIDVTTDWGSTAPAAAVHEITPAVAMVYNFEELLAISDVHSADSIIRGTSWAPIQYTEPQYVEGTAWVSGRYSGNVTIVAGGDLSDLIITGNLEPMHPKDSLLLIASRDIVIAPAQAMAVITINASLSAGERLIATSNNLGEVRLIGQLAAGTHGIAAAPLELSSATSLLINYDARWFGSGLTQEAVMRLKPLPVPFLNLL